MTRDIWHERNPLIDKLALVYQSFRVWYTIPVASSSLAGNPGRARWGHGAGPQLRDRSRHLWAPYIREHGTGPSGAAVRGDIRHGARRRLELSARTAYQLGQAQSDTTLRNRARSP